MTNAKRIKKERIKRAKAHRNAAYNAMAEALSHYEQVNSAIRRASREDREALIYERDERMADLQHAKHWYNMADLAVGDAKAAPGRSQHRASFPIPPSGGGVVTGPEQSRHWHPVLAAKVLDTALPTIYHSDNSDYFISRFDQPITREASRTSRGEHVIDHHHPGTGRLLILDEAPRSVLLALIPHHAPIHHRMLPVRCYLNDCSDQEISANRKASYRGRGVRQTVRFVKHPLCNLQEHASIKQRSLAIEVEAGLLTAAQGKRTAPQQASLIDAPEQFEVVNMVHRGNCSTAIQLLPIHPS